MTTRTGHPGGFRWQRSVAWAAFWVTVPSGVWRVLMIVGLLPGTADLREFYLVEDPASGYGYVIGISVAQLGTGFLSVGLVRPWGERLFGRNVPMVPVLGVAILGGLIVTYLFTSIWVAITFYGARPDGGLVNGIPFGVMVACYIPIFFWGPLELLASYGYWHRRRHVSYRK